MAARQARWLTTQQATIAVNTTSAEVCRLLSLSGEKPNNPAGPATANG